MEQKKNEEGVILVVELENLSQETHHNWSETVKPTITIYETGILRGHWSFCSSRLTRNVSTKGVESLNISDLSSS